MTLREERAPPAFHPVATRTKIRSENKIKQESKEARQRWARQRSEVEANTERKDTPKMNPRFKSRLAVPSPEGPYVRLNVLRWAPRIKLEHLIADSHFRQAKTHLLGSHDCWNRSSVMVPSTMSTMLEHNLPQARKQQVHSRRRQQPAIFARKNHTVRYRLTFVLRRKARFLFLLLLDDTPERNIPVCGQKPTTTKSPTCNQLARD